LSSSVSVSSNAIRFTVISHAKDGEVMPTNKRLLSLDGWAILLSLSLAALIRLGVLKAIPW